jgi:uncharacterized protein (TIGR00730 family)
MPEDPRPPQRVPHPAATAAEGWLREQFPQASDRSISLAAEFASVAHRLLDDGADTGELKLMAAAAKEMRHAYRVFRRYRGVRKVSIFGSARTPPQHPDYDAARRFGQVMAERGWMAITGAGDGIMKAGHEGPRREGAFGLAISLPFETSANTIIQGDPKLINFRYFFTRKLMFVSQSDAFAVFPGGFGTQDELFEALTLIQTGKSPIVPVVMLEGEGGDYWSNWVSHLRHDLLRHGWISPEDMDLFRVCATPAEAADEVVRFYRVYQGSRYVGDRLALRLRHPISDLHLAQLEEEFRPLIAEGGMELGSAHRVETEATDLPRLSFAHNRRHFGLLRRLIDRLNQLDPP